MPHGTWQTTGGGGFDASALIGLGAFVGAVVGVAFVIERYFWWIVACGAVAVAVRVYVLHRRAVASRAIAATFAREHQAREADAAAALAGQRQHELAVAAASVQPAPQVHIVNTIDPAAILAAAFGGVQYQPQPVHVVHVVRGEVER